MASAAIVSVTITGNSSGLTIAYKQAAAQTQAFGRAVSGSAASATKSLSGIGRVAKSALGSVVPLAAAGAGIAVAAFAKQSIDAAVEYNRAMTRIAALTNATTAEIDVMADRIMSLSAETATAPVELAHSMYYLASAGLTTEQQLETLTATAKGAAVGLGEAGDLAKISANALNVFADNGLRAADVMDVMVAAVREGTAEPDEFADAMGRVLPIADKAGISFEQVAASLATMSNAGLKVNIGTTALRGLLQALVAPTQLSQNALADLGLTVDDVVDSMRQEGLISTLRMLDTTARKNTESTGQYNILMRELVPNIRALTGAFNLTTQEAAKVDRIFKDVARSTGSLDEAFRETAESPSFKVRKAFADIARVGQNLATAVLPFIASALQGLAAVFKVAASPVVKLVGAFLAFKGLQVVFAVIASAAESLAAALFVTLIPALKALASSSPLGLFLMGLGTVMLALSGNAKVAAIGIGVLVVAVGTATKAFTAAQASMGAFGLAALAVSEAVSAVQGLERQTDEAAAGFSDSMLQGKASLDTYRSSVEAVNPHQNIFAGMLSGTGRAWQAFDQAAEQATNTIRNQNSLILDGTPLYGVYGSVLDNTSNMNLRMHGTLTQLIRDFYEQNGTLSGLNMTAVTAQVEQGKLGKAIDIVSEALKRSNDALTESISKGGTTGLAKAFLAAAPALDAIGMSMEDFQAQATEALNTHKWDEFAATISEDFTTAWNDFHDAAFNALNFLPGALSELTSAAQSAKDSLADMEPPSKDLDPQGLRDYNTELSTLQSTANLTGEEILRSFQDSAQASKDFGTDLLEVSRIGGRAGKDLAAALMESGNVMAAQIIADQPHKLQKQIVGAFGKSQTATEKFATQLTDAIVGPLESIAFILRRIAKAWGINLELQEKTDIQQHLKDVHIELDQLTGHDYKVRVGFHGFAESPWPDEIMRDRIINPLSKFGFRHTGDVWKLPVQVAIHTTGEGLKKLPNARDLGAKTMERAFDGVYKAVRAVNRSLSSMATNGRVAGKALVGALSKVGPATHDLASGVGDSGQDMRRQLVDDFNAILNAGQSSANKLQTSLTNALTAIRNLLTAVARPWTVNVQANTEAAKAAITNFHAQLVALVARSFRADVEIHIHPASPWPDEALQTHLMDPLRRSGFLKVGGVWTLPLQVPLHTDADAASIDTAAMQDSASRLTAALDLGTVDTSAAQDSLSQVGAAADEAAKRTEEAVAADAPEQVKKASLRFSADLSKVRAKLHDFGFRKVNGHWTLPVTMRTDATKTGGGGTGGGTGGGGGGGTGDGGGGRDGGGDRYAVPGLPKPNNEDFSDRWNSMLAAVKDLRRSVVDVEGRKASLRWMHDMLVELHTAGTSAKQIELFRQAIEDVKTSTTPQEAADAAAAFASAIREHDKKFGDVQGGVKTAPSVKNMVGFNKPGDYGEFDTMFEVLRNLKGFVADQQGSTEAHKWMQDIAKLLKKPGTSAEEAKLVKQALRDVKLATTAKEAKAAAEAFHDAMAEWNRQHEWASRDKTLGPKDPEWAAFAFKNVPGLPAGHTRIDPNLHNRPRPLRVLLDRKHFDDQAAYEEAYRGF